MSVEWSADLTIAGPSNTALEWQSLLMEPLQLFAFLVDRPMPAERIWTNSGKGRADVYSSWLPTEAPSTTTPLLTLRDIGDRFGAMVAVWKRLAAEASALVHHVDRFQAFRQRDAPHDQLLTLARCIELYHDFSDAFASRLRSRAEHRRAVSTVIESLPAAARPQLETWVRDALGEANHKRLRTQFEEVASSVGHEVLEACRIEDCSEFAAAVKRSRNYFTHPTGPQPSDVRDGRELVVMVNQIWFIVRACLLAELGFTSEETRAALQRSSRSHYVFA